MNFLDRKTKKHNTIRLLLGYSIYHPEIDGGFYTLRGDYGYVNRKINPKTKLHQGMDVEKLPKNIVSDHIMSTHIIIKEKDVGFSEFNDFFNERYFGPIISCLINDMKNKVLREEDLVWLKIDNDIRGAYYEVTQDELDKCIEKQ